MGTRVKVGGEGVREAFVGIISEFRVTFEGSDTDELDHRVSVCIRRGEGAEREPVDVYVVDGRVFYVQYMPREEGEVLIEILLDGGVVFKQALVARDPRGVSITVIVNVATSCSL